MVSGKRGLVCFRNDISVQHLEGDQCVTVGHKTDIIIIIIIIIILALDIPVSCKCRSNINFIYISFTFKLRTDTRPCSWLRHCATSRKIAGSIPDGLTGIFFRPHYGPGVDSSSNRNEYQGYLLGGKGGLCVRLTNLKHSCVDCLEILDPQPPGILRACPGIALHFTLRNFQC